jgi:hypothetical protein
MGTQGIHRQCLGRVGYEAHANLIQPEDNNAYIWRFIDVPKFLDILVIGSLGRPVTPHSVAQQTKVWPDSDFLGREHQPSSHAFDAPAPRK